MTQPIHEQVLKIMADVPPDELAKLPVDGAANHDRYLYGGRAMSNDDGGPAFPCDSTNKQLPTQCGMSLIDWFAGQETLDDCHDLNWEHLCKATGHIIPLFDEDPLGFMRWEAEMRAMVKYMRAAAMIAESERRRGES